MQKQDHGLADVLDNQLIELCKPALEKQEKVTLDLPIRNVTALTQQHGAVSILLVREFHKVMVINFTILFARSNLTTALALS